MLRCFPPTCCGSHSCMMPPPTHACTHARSHYRCCCFRCHPLAELKGKLNGLAIRVPLLNASITDCVFVVKRPTTAEEVNALLKVFGCRRWLVVVIGRGWAVGFAASVRATATAGSL